MKRGFLLFTLLSLILVNLTAPVGALGDGTYGDGPRVGSPIVQVLKWTDTNEIELGSNITVYVNITNWSDFPAYNLTITEPIFSNWSRTDFVGYDDYVYVMVDSNASISYQYTLTMLNEGNYTIEPTVINYVDINGTEFTAYSSYIPLDVYIIPPKLDLDQIWLNILWLSGLFILVPVSFLQYMKYKK